MEKHILLVDDDKLLVHACQICLEKEGFKVTIASDGEVASEWLKTNSPDLILLDLVLPKKDGFALLEEIHAQETPPPVMILSNLGQEEDLKRVEKYGVVAYFIKSNKSMGEIAKSIKAYFGA